MTIFGLNSPEIFVLLLILLIILGTKRIEKGLILFSKLLKFLLKSESSFEKLDKKKEPIKVIEDSKEQEEENTKTLELNKPKEKEPIKVIEDSKDQEEENTKTAELNKPKEKESIKVIYESQDQEDKSEKRLKIANTEVKGKKSIKTKDPKGKVQDQTIKTLKSKNQKSIIKDKNVNKSKTLKVQDEQLDK